VSGHFGSIKVNFDYVIEADGGSRGNPGPAGSGAIIIDGSTGSELYEVSRFIGIATNNVAEYTAVLSALMVIDGLTQNARISVRMDSKLVVEQMSGRWKIKHPDMQILASEVQRLAAKHSITWQWIPRELNSRADGLANRAMDLSSDSDVELSREASKTKDSTPTEQSTPPALASVTEFNTTLPSSVRAPGRVTAKLTTVVLVRHGRTELTESKRMSGRGGANPGLSAAGFQDAQKVALELSKFGVSGPWGHLPKPNAIVSSPIQRTIDTANSIAKVLDLEVQPLEEFAEISFGEWDGLTHEEAQRMWPSEWESWQGSWTAAPPKGESLEDFDRRIELGRSKLFQQFAGQTVVLVAHVMPIRAMIKAAIDGGIATYWRPQISPCSISVIRFWADEAAEIQVINSTAHLI
jgi:probable phosphoglycerate mutase